MRSLTDNPDPISIGELQAIERRMGVETVRRRLKQQADKRAGLRHQGEGIMRIERILPVDRLFGWVLGFFGLAARARENFLDVRVAIQQWELDSLPPSFDGFRLLQLSDLHLDLDPDLISVVRRLVESQPHDGAVVTGDFRNSTKADFRPSMEATAPVIQVLQRPCWGVLGNHDFLEMVPHLERAGLPMLLNEAASVRRGDEQIWIAGVDDPHFYRTHDLRAACRGIPDGAFKILLSHTPEIASEAGGCGFDLMLAGHTHGGQVCLPGGRALVLPVKSLAPDLVVGRWKRGKMHGYTSPGTGSCGVAARFNCPPEITIHVLRRTRCGTQQAKSN